MILDRAHASSARLCAAATGAFILAGCTGGQQSTSGSGAPAASSAAQSGRVQVAATISTLAALVRSVAGDRADVFSVVPVGVSPETYDPAPRDLIAISNAQLIVRNGAGLEQWLDKMLRTAANPKARVLVLADGMPVLGATSDNSFGNPHLWLDPVYAQAYVHKIASALREVDPAGAQTYTDNERSEIARLQDLDRWIRAQVATIPPDQRAMITFHDAWVYYDHRYGIRDVGAIEPSPGQQPSAGYLASLIKLAHDNHVRAVFAEPQFSPKLAEQLASSAGIKTVSDLYDDTLGTTPELQTYEGMMKYDTDAIVKALRT